MDRAGKANDDLAFMRLDRELNLLLSEAAQNEYAARAMRFLQGHSRRFWYLHYKQAADLPLCARLHARQARADRRAAIRRRGRRLGPADRLHRDVHARDRHGRVIRGRDAPRPLSFTRPARLANILVIYQTAGGDGRSMKTYEGKRNIDGLVVTVDGQPLREHYEVKQFTTWGFEWTYEGTSPQQLALAILYDHLGDKERAIRLSEPFMKKVVAELDNDWTLDQRRGRTRDPGTAGQS